MARFGTENDILMFDFIKDTFDTIQDVILMFVLSVQFFFEGIASLAVTIFEMINGKGTDDYQLIGAILAIFFGIAGIVITFMFIGQVVVVALALISIISTVVIAVLTTLVDYIIPAVPLFILAKRNNYKYPWFAFIPIMQSVLEFNLPDAKFEVLF